MKVVHVGLESSADRIGGLNRYFEALLGAERRDGLDAVGVVLGDQHDPTSDDGIVTVSPSGSIFARSRRIDGAVRRRGAVDLADVHFSGTGFVPTVIGALRRVPFVVHFQGPWADESVATGASRHNVRLKRAMEKMVYRRASRFVVLSSSFASLLSDRYGVAPWSIEVVPPGVDLDRFTTGDAAAARAVVAAGTGRVVVAVRRLVPRMGLEVLLRAWHEMGPAQGDQLAIVGDGPDEGALRALASSLGIASSVRFCGRVDDATLVQWYRAADLTVVPSVALEGFGLVVLESLACGTPVLGTDADGLREALALVDATPPVTRGDVRGLAAEMRRRLAEPRTAHTTAHNREIAERHGWNEVARRHRRLYEQVLDRDAPLRVVVLDHTAVLSGGELAIARALEGVEGQVSAHAILATEGPLRARLDAAGVSVEVLELDEATRNVRRRDVRPSRLRPHEALAAARYVARLSRRLRELRPDVVHTNSLKSALYGGVAARLSGVPCVWHVRDRIERPYLPGSAVRLVRLLARVLPTVVVANSNATLTTVGVAQGVVIPSPLDPSITAHERSPESRELRIAVIGRLAEWKGQRLAIAAFAEAFPSSGATLQIAGSAMFGEEAYADALPSYAADLGVGDRVVFRGFVDDVASLLDDTDVVVHSSVLPEPFGQVVIEAMGAGCAVIVADAGGPAELVNDGVNGLLYPIGDAKHLADAMRRLADDPALRVRLGDTATETAAGFTPESLAPLLVGVWHTAALRGRRRHRRRGRRRG